MSGISLWTNLANAADVFPVCQSGGHATQSSHVSLARKNAQELQPLSVVVQPLARLRSEADPDEESSDDLEGLREADANKQNFGKAAAFAFLSASSTASGSQQDLVVYRQLQGHIDLVRLDVRSRQMAQSTTSGSPRGSGITEMMKDRGLLGREKPLVAEYRVIGRWSTEFEGDAKPVFVNAVTDEGDKRAPSPQATRIE